MGRFELKHPSFGAVMGTIGAVLGLAAFIVSLTTNASALSSHPTVRKGDIAPGAVTAKALAQEAVHPKALAKGAVKSKALAKGAVNARVLADGVVTAAKLAPSSVTSQAIAPGSVYGGALRPVTVRTAPIADLDTVPANPDWTLSNTEAAICAPGERLLGAGFGFTNPGNRQVAFLQAMPYSNAQANGVSGLITSNSGGIATALVAAVCLG